MVERRLTSSKQNACRSLLLAAVRPTFGYGSVLWEANKAQAAALESIVLGRAKCILGCSSCNVQSLSGY